MACWLVKTEPEEYSWDDLVREERTAWTGVRNFQARNNLRAMRLGEPCLYYHSSEQRAVVGVARVAREAYADPTAAENGWVCVDLVPEQPLVHSVTILQIKTDLLLREMVVVRQGRLSVSPVTHAEFGRLLDLGGLRQIHRAAS